MPPWLPSVQDLVPSLPGWKLPSLLSPHPSLGRHVPDLPAPRLPPLRTRVRLSARSRPITSVPATTRPPPFAAPPSCRPVWTPPHLSAAPPRPPPAPLARRPPPDPSPSPLSEQEGRHLRVRPILLPSPPLHSPLLPSSRRRERPRPGGRRWHRAGLPSVVARCEGREGGN